MKKYFVFAQAMVTVCEDVYKAWEIFKGKETNELTETKEDKEDENISK